MSLETLKEMLMPTDRMASSSGEGLSVETSKVVMVLGDLLYMFSLTFSRVVKGVDQSDQNRA